MSRTRQRTMCQLLEHDVDERVSLMQAEIDLAYRRRSIRAIHRSALPEVSELVVSRLGQIGRIIDSEMRRFTLPRYRWRLDLIRNKGQRWSPLGIGLEMVETSHRLIELPSAAGLRDETDSLE
jgi:hypothetical protein